RALSARSPLAVQGTSTNDPYQPVKAFLNEHSALFGHDATLLSSAKISRDGVAAHNGLRTTVWQQMLDGIPVFESVLIGNTTKRGELVSLSSQFLPNPAAAADAGTPNRAAIRMAPAIS